MGLRFEQLWRSGFLLVTTKHFSSVKTEVYLSQIFQLGRPFQKKMHYICLTIFDN